MRDIMNPNDDPLRKAFYFLSSVCDGVSLDDAMRTYTASLLKAFVHLDGFGNFELVAYCPSDNVFISRLTFKTTHHVSDVVQCCRRLQSIETIKMDLSGLADPHEHDRLDKLMNKSADEQVTYHYIAKNSKYIDKIKTSREFVRVKVPGWMGEESLKSCAANVSASI